MSRGSAESGTALDLLEREDIELRSIFGQVRAAQGWSVEDRADYGDLAKTVIRRVATREAALVDVASVAGQVPALEALTERIEQLSSIRREALDKVEKMSRGVQGINLNTGQDFDKEFSALMQIVGSEIEWDLDEAIPAVRSALEQHDKVGDLTSADKVAKRAPTNLSPKGPRWYERAPVLSRFISTYDRLRDFPHAVRQR
jgi:hypothetical protein